MHSQIIDNLRKSLAEFEQVVFAEGSTPDPHLTVAINHELAHEIYQGLKSLLNKAEITDSVA